MFDLSDSEFEEFLRQVTRAHGPVQESCMTTPEPPNKPTQTTAPQPGAIYMGTLGTPGVNTLSFVPAPDAEKIQFSANTPQPPPTGNGQVVLWQAVARSVESLNLAESDWLILTSKVNSGQIIQLRFHLRYRG